MIVARLVAIGAIGALTGCFVTIADLEDGGAAGEGGGGGAGHGGSTSSSPLACLDYLQEESACPDHTVCMAGCCQITEVPATAEDAIDITSGHTLCWDGCGPDATTNVCADSVTALFLKSGPNPHTPGATFTIKWVGDGNAISPSHMACGTFTCGGQNRLFTAPETEPIELNRDAACEPLELKVFVDPAEVPCQ